jgi:DNA-binding beta-propeller fold protein YncE
VDDELGLVCVASSGTLNEGGSVPSTLGVLTTHSGELVRRVALGQHLQTLLVDTTTHHAFVADGGPWGGSGEPEEPGILYTLDLATGATLASAQVGVDPVAMAVDPALGVLLVAGAADQSVTFLDTQSGAVLGHAQVGRDPQRIVVAPGTGRAVVANYSDASVTLLDVVEGAVVTTIGCGDAPSTVTLDARMGQVLVANCQGNTVHVLDLESGASLEVLTTAARPMAIVVDPATGYTFMTHLATPVSNQRELLTILSPATSETGTPQRSLVKTVTIGAHPWEMLVDATAHYLFITNVGSNEVSIVDIDDVDPARAFGALVLTVPIQILPRHLAHSPRTGHVFVTSDYHQRAFAPYGGVTMLTAGAP